MKLPPQNIFLSTKDQIWALETARKTIEQYLKDGSTYEPTEIPEIFTEEKRTIFVTIYNTKIHNLIGCQGAKSISEAAQKATQDKRFESIKKSGLPNIKISITILNQEEKIPDITKKGYLELGIHGLTLKRNGEKRATFLPHVPIAHNYSRKELLERLCIKAKLPKDSILDPENTYYRFTAFSFVEDGSGGAISLRRLNNFLETIDRENVESMLSGVSEWLSLKVKEDGSFKYSYLPSEDENPDEYNIIRHIGSTYGLLLINKIEKAKKCIDYFLKHWQDKENIALGSYAVGTITLLKYYQLTGEKSYFKKAKEMGRFILDMQKDDGNFKNFHPTEKPERIGTYEIYGAEANLALVRLYKETKEKKYLKALEKSFNYSEKYFKKTPSTKMLSWDISAFSELYYLTKEKKYADLAFYMADWAIDNNQYYNDSPFWDYLGGYNNTPSSGSTGTYSEGIGDALKLAIETGDKNREKKYRRSLQLSMRFLANLQFREDNSFYLKNPEEALGGFRHNMYKNKQRIDTAQHIISATTKALALNVY